MKGGVKKSLFFISFNQEQQGVPLPEGGPLLVPLPYFTIDHLRNVMRIQKDSFSTSIRFHTTKKQFERQENETRKVTMLPPDKKMLCIKMLNKHIYTLFNLIERNDNKQNLHKPN